MTYRVWYRDGSSREVTAASEQEAKRLGREAAEREAADLNDAYRRAKAEDPARADELSKEWRGRTTVRKVEVL